MAVKPSGGPEEPKPTGGPDDTGTTGGTTTTSGGSSGSSGGSAEPQDPYDKWYGDISAIDRKRVSVFDQIYQQLWGEPAPLAVLQAAVNQGLNRWEFEEAQKRNPAWWKTEAAEDAGRQFDLLLEQMGLVPKRKPKKGKDRRDKPDLDRPGGPGFEQGPPNKRKRANNPPDMIGPPEVRGGI